MHNLFKQMNHPLSITFGSTDEPVIFPSFYKLNRLCLYHKAIFIFSPSFQESYPKKRNYTMEIVPSASLDTFPSENENFLCDPTDTAVTKKPCSLEIARAPSPRTGNVSYNLICVLVYVKICHSYFEFPQYFQHGNFPI